MKKTLLSTALVAVMAAAGFAPNANATDGTITITGNVTSTTCVVGAGSPSNVPVTLPTVSTTALNTVGATAGYKQFSISVNGCATGTKVTTYFEQGPNTLADGNLKNVAPSGSNVEVQLFLQDQTTPITLNSAAGAQGVVPVTVSSSGAATLNYWAAYKAATAAASAGAVSTSVQYTMQYQ